jgi:hypothetical protein
MEVFFNTGTRRVLTVIQLVSVMQEGVGTFQEFEVVDHVHPRRVRVHDTSLSVLI